MKLMTSMHYYDCKFGTKDVQNSRELIDLHSAIPSSNFTELSNLTRSKVEQSWNTLLISLKSFQSTIILSNIDSS